MKQCNLKYSICILLLCLSVFAGINQLKAQNTLNLVGLTASTPAASAYSLRKLSNSYAGNAIQVRRSNDNATQNIGFTANGDLDTAALKTFVGANDGLVATWYDQSGNARNLTQATTSKQPTIVNAGVVYRKGKQPALFLDVTNDGMLYSGANYLTTNPLSVNLVAGSNSSNTNARRAVQGTINWLIGPYQNKLGWYASGWNNQIAVPWSQTYSEIFTVIQPTSTACTSWRNGASQTSANNKGTPNKIQIGVEGAYSEPLNGHINEVISFNAELSNTDRQTLESSQTTYYQSTNTNAVLANLAISTGALTPSFADTTLNYFSNYLGVTTTTVTPISAVPGTIIQVRINGGSYSTVSSGTASVSLALTNAINPIDIKVTALDGVTQKIYTVTATLASENWTGAISTDWNTAGNWSANVVPSNLIGAIIPNGLSKYPVISGGINASAKYVTVNDAASLTLNTNSNLTINGYDGNSVSIRAYGTINNAGKITIGSSAVVGNFGIYINGTINNNTGGEINIDQVNRDAIHNENGYIINAGKITISANLATASSVGIYNGSNFNNNIGGEVYIDRCKNYGLFNSDDNQVGASLNNSGKITIGAISTTVASAGIYNISILNNNTSGEIYIDQCRDFAMYNVDENGTGAYINNSGKLIIGTIATAGTYAVYNTTIFTNNAGAVINIDRSTNTALYNESDFNNSGKITIGANTAVGADGILINSNNFINNACGIVAVIQGNFTNNANVDNSGYLQINSTLNNNSTFTNNAVLKYGTLAGSITSTNNASVIVNNSTPIFTYGGNYNGTINGMYSNALATVLAGSFTAPNSFSTNAIPGGAQTLYASITPAGGSCSYIVPFTFNNTNSVNWTGATNTNWNVAGNWSNSAVPASNTAVTIPVVTNYPVLTGATSIGFITVLPGANISLNGQSLTTGGIAGPGVIKGSTTSSLVVNAGANNTLYFGSTATDSLLANLTVGGISAISTGVGITGKLSVTGGTLNTNGHLTLKSTSITNTASLDVVAGTITGTATVERYIPKGLRSFRDLSAGGVANAGSFYNNWQEGGATIAGKGIYITGKTGVASGVDATTGLDITSLGNSSLYAYGAGVWPAVTNTKSNSINPFQGYRVLVRGDRNYNNFGFVNDAAVMNNSTVLRTSGNFIMGNVTYTTTGVTNNIYSSSAATLVAGTAAYSLIANPYACPIDWEAVYANAGTSNVTSSYWYFDPTFLSAGFATYVTYNAVSHVNSNPISKVNRYIQPGMAFFVQNSGTTPTVAFTESNKAPNSTKTAVFRTEAPNYIHVSLWKNINEENTNIDGAVAVFNSNFTKVIGEKDSKKLTNGGENIFITQTNTDLSIAGLPVPTENEEIKLNLSQLVSGITYQLQIDAAQFTTNGLDVFIKDILLNTIAPATEVINFTPTNDVATYQGRFSVVFKAAKFTSTSVKGAVSIYPNPVSNGKFNLQLSNLEKGTYTVRVLNSLGQEVIKNFISNEVGISNNNIFANSLATGVYTVQVVGKAGTYTTELIINK